MHTCITHVHIQINEYVNTMQHTTQYNASQQPIATSDIASQKHVAQIDLHACITHANRCVQHADMLAIPSYFIIMSDDKRAVKLSIIPPLSSSPIGWA